MSKGRDKIKFKKSLFFGFFQKHKKIATVLVIGVGFLGFFFTLNYGRYVKDVIQMFYLRSQNFYFSSDKLTIHGKTYEINPWSGTVNYDISISMSSLLNSIKGTDDNISYTVSCEGDSKVDCYIDAYGLRSEDRTIITDTHSDNYIVTVVPRSGVVFTDGEIVKVDVVAEATVPYKETLSATFELVIGNYGVNYAIEDNISDNYLNTYVTNTLDTDTVNVVLEINPDYHDEIFFDMSNPIIHQDSYKVEEILTIDGYDYITKISFDLKPKSSLMVKYFKTDLTKDYSYIQGDSKEPVVKFSYN